MMRPLRYIICIMLLMPMLSMAQNNKDLFKYEIGKLNREFTGRMYVKPGEFKICFDDKIIDAEYGKVYKYFVIVRNIKGEVAFVLMNNYYLNMMGSEYPAEIVKAGYTIPEYVYIEKRQASALETGKYKYTLHVDGKAFGPYDGILEVLPDGFVYKNKEVFAYSRYDNDILSNRNYCILEKDTYEGEYIQCVLNDKLLKFTPKEKPSYYKSYEGHYYILYNDAYMKNSLIVVDGEGYELDGTENSVLFRFSHNGDHWIAAGKNYVLKDGVIVAKSDKIIKRIVINDNGDYMYVAAGQDGNEVIYHGDNVMVTGIKVLKLVVDDDERFYYIFKKGKDYFCGINNDVQSMAEELEKCYYPELFDANQTFTIKSTDGNHTFVYSYNTPYITIDGTRIECPSIPHYAIWNERDKCFMWNAVEDVNLVVYKYKIHK